MPAKQNFIQGHEYDLGDGTTAVWGGKKGWVSAEEYVAAKGQDQASFDDNRAMYDRLGRVRKHAKRFGATGALARLTSGEGLPEWSPFKGIGGTAGYDLDKELVPVRSNFFIQNLQKMRVNSPTGGAVGNVTEKEGQKLESTNGILDVGQSYPQFVNEVDETRGAMDRHVTGLTPNNAFALREDNRGEIPQGAYFRAADGRVYQNKRGAGPGGQSVPPPEQRQRGQVYQTPKGPMRWTGTGWVQ
jgi:hypothetical protein